ncbi:MAG: DUF3667 domain-containing protein [Flavobacteriales bacterium]|nr:DUF3667 domain-containing protein [Flavobacteriales bacterium]
MKTKTCLNCSSDLLEHQNYCPNCGQKNRKVDYRLRDLLLHFFEDYFAFDNKIIQTLILLIKKPGQLSLAFFEGKRMSYVLPLKLYFFVAFISLLLMSALDLFTFQSQDSFVDGFSEGIEISYDSSEDSGGEEQAEIDALGLDVGKDISYVLKEKSALFILFEMPVFAFFIYLFFYKKNRYYTEAFVVALHIQTLFFISIFLGKLLGMISPMASLFFILVYLVYATLSLKRYYQNGLVVSFMKLFAIQLLQVLVVLGITVLYIFIRLYSSGFTQ